MIALSAWIPTTKTTYIAPPRSIEIPIELKRIGSCESTGSPYNEPVQFNEDGTVLRGRVNSRDVGAYQINEFYWLEKSVELGIDIYTEEGNKEMALWIYNQNGTSPWNWSKECWGPLFGG